MTLYYESKVMQKAPEIHAKYDPVLRIKSYAKNTRNSRRIWLCTKNQKLCKKHQIFTQIKAVY